MSIWHQIWSLVFIVGVIGNLTASAILGIPALISLHKKLDRHHAEHLRIMAGHGTIRRERQVQEMPYSVRKQEGTENYEVINTETDEVKAVHEPPDAKDKAEKQVHLLESIEHDPGWE
jgi:hypothetical protein